MKFYRENMEKMELSSSLKKVWAFVSRANKYIDETAPWALAKDESRKQELANVLYNLAESLRQIAVLISPYMPDTGKKIWTQLALEDVKPFAEVQLTDIDAWGGIPAGHKVGEAEQLFPRIEAEDDAAAAKKAAKEQAAANKAAKKAKREAQRKLNEKKQ